MRLVDKHRQFSVIWRISSHGHWANKDLTRSRKRKHVWEIHVILQWTFICSVTVHIAVWIWYTPACRKAGFGMQKVGNNQSVQRSKKHQRRPLTWRQRKCSMYCIYSRGRQRGNGEQLWNQVADYSKWWLRQEKLSSEGYRTGEKGQEEKTKTKRKYQISHLSLSLWGITGDPLLTRCNGTRQFILMNITVTDVNADKFAVSFYNLFLKLIYKYCSSDKHQDIFFQSFTVCS